MEGAMTAGGAMAVEGCSDYCCAAIGKRWEVDSGKFLVPAEGPPSIVILGADHPPGLSVWDLPTIINNTIDFYPPHIDACVQSPLTGRCLWFQKFEVKVSSTVGSDGAAQLALANMDDYILPSTAYQAASRLAGNHTLNTIIEDKRGERQEDYGREEDESERLGRTEYIAPRSVGSTSPVPSLTSSVSSYYFSRRSEDFDSASDISYEDSDISLSIIIDPNTMRSGSPNEYHSTTDKAKRYPSLVIPSPSLWPSVPSTKTAQVSPPRPPKIPLSPAALSMLGHELPRLSNLPSLAGSLSSDPHAASSCPVTPEMNTHPENGDVWGQGTARLTAESLPVEDDSNKAQRPRIRIWTQANPEWPHDSAIAPEDHVEVRDFARRDLPDSPVLGPGDESAKTGVELPLEALITLQHLSLESPAPRESGGEHGYSIEMQESQLPLRSSGEDMTPASAASEYSISGFSIPSPGDFFASLGSNARRAWHVGSVPPSAIPPSSTTAEQFYNCPWNRDFAPPVEHVVEWDGNGTDTDGPPTARQAPLASANSTQTAFHVPDIQPAQDTTPIIEHAQDYEKVIEDMADISLDRTSMWLAQQTSYLSALRETNPVNDISAQTNCNINNSGTLQRNDSLGSPLRKVVHFLETETGKHQGQTSESPESGDSIYYHAFQLIKSSSKHSDAFTHRLARSDSVQSVRLCLPHEHTRRLQGQYLTAQMARPSTQRPISTMSGIHGDAGDETIEQKVIARVEKERQALEQVNARTWVIEASKYLAGGSLLNSPARNKTVKTPKLGDIKNGRVRNPGRVLDLGGLPNGDWAWHCAREFPHAKIYTATTDRHLIDSRIRGPHNHRCTAVTSLWKLPYPDDFFHAISARSLYAYLKNEKPIGEDADEYDLCLRECLRCLKPGGYLEFSLQDSEIVNAGSCGTAASVEFGFNLRTRGYDPAPTKSWLARVKRAGFDDIKRAWTYLPIGSPNMECPQLPETPPPNVSTFDSNNSAVGGGRGPVGSTEDAATLSGLVGSWAWEQWMLRLQLEMGKENFLEGVGAVLAEGKRTGAGWRCLSGWARKPLEMRALR
ncbi:MAG: hypothetical protein Q9163_001443 [Psora crenata]